MSLESHTPENADSSPAPPVIPQATPQATQCATELMETIPAVMQFIRTEMRGQNAALLSVPQFRVLGFLNRHPNSSLSEVAEHLGVTRATASAMTDRLVQRGFLSRIDDPQKRRQVMLNLTEVGSNQLQQSRGKTRDTIAELMQPLTEEQLLSLSAGLAILRKVFDSVESEPAS
ncbi:MAG: MarR family transcriptional regulator [Drouetiella hepatica Uher 2000/2452]|uniref:MarR family transcriptional regulator n=1 Tax=Drouetiella hepatica Uher 2000/2452 TaxID=904376 RepID=A0A951Q921_9CYAN|nr:MarR family transcriptional regulator [Drouetiella hepatica Uher 2000/2452]